ncbi:MAG: hypothetical protein LBG96_18205 [Tannerella sp.]|jgi:SAM-dependent methyltransferase|nr:hypothetical protein [Tannerella sp.]
MGISRKSLLSMCYMREKGVDFTHTVTIGRQSCLLNKREIDLILAKYDPLYLDKGVGIIESMFAKSQFSESLFEYFGAKYVDSIDYSDFESATIIHDMNTPVEEHLKNKYTLVWDGGCLEHVFNFPVAIKNCMDMVKPHGHLILETPANNFFGHGFYQFSPELFFSLLDTHNSFINTKIYMQDNAGNWYEVPSFKEIGKRLIMPPSSRESLMLVVSEKMSEVPETLSVYQSDYVAEWKLPPPAAANSLKTSLLLLVCIKRQGRLFHGEYANGESVETS